MGVRPRALILACLLILGVAIFVYSSQRGAMAILEPTMKNQHIWNKGSAAVMTTKIENATLKAELGRKTWYFLHNVAAKFPLFPTNEEKEAFLQFIHLFSRVYPCISAINN